MALRAALLLLACTAALLAADVHAQAPYRLPPLDYPTNAIEPHIDNETMFLHHRRHHNASINNLNTALSQAPAFISSLKLTVLLERVGSFASLPRNVSTSIRNNGGSHFNHALYWKTLRPTKAAATNVRSGPLNAAIRLSFRSFRALNDTFSVAASRVFGSGWTWLCVKPKDKKTPLAIVSTPNQDNPLMRYIVPAADQCIPILGIDLWEHAHYLKHRNLRNRYIADWWKAVDWARVSRNYANALAGRLEALWK